MLSTIIATMRPNFLILAPLCVTVAWGYADSIGLTVGWLDIVLCYVAALLSHASVNMLNEYHDHHSGLDFNTQRTPFSGGSGALQSQPQAAKITRVMALVLLAITVLIGVYFVVQVGIGLMLIGLLAIACVWFYTPTINQLSWLCFVAPGFGFGIVFSYGSFIAIGGSYEVTMLIVCLPLFLLVNNLLLLNQFPDRDADQQSGRNHLIIKYGERAGLIAYILNVVGVVIVTLWLSYSLSLGWPGGLLILPLLAAIAACTGLVNYLKNKDIRAFLPFMASNVIATLSYPAILSTLLFMQ